MRRRLIFTVDLDRDANLPLEGSIAAGSMDRGSGTGPRFSSAERGLGLLLEILDSLGVPGTFFVEGRTAETIDCSAVSGHMVGFHGYDHEDLTGASTGVIPDDDALESILRKGFDAVSDNVARPVCFRAPYMSKDDRVLAAASGLGIRHDSSEYTTGDPTPYPIACGMTEHPVPKGNDASGKTIAAYLWPMHEGKRTPEDYIGLAEQYGGDFILATHTWHMVERREAGIMDDSAIRKNSENVSAVLEGIMDLGFEPSVLF